MADTLTQKDNMIEVNNVAEQIAKLILERDRISDKIIDLTFILQDLGYLWKTSESKCETIEIVKFKRTPLVKHRKKINAYKKYLHESKES